MRGPAARGRCERRAGCTRARRPVPFRRRFSPALPPGRHPGRGAAGRSARGHPGRQRWGLRPAPTAAAGAAVAPAASCSCLSRPHRASRRGGAGPAGVERSLRPVLRALPQVSTPGALASASRVCQGGTLHSRLPPRAAFLPGASRVRTSAPSPPPPPGSAALPPASRASRGRFAPTWEIP